MRPVAAVAIVTPEYGEVFAREWCALDLLDAFHATNVMTWPDDPAGQEKFKAIEDEIIERTIEAVKPVLAEAFVKAANDVLTRERQRGHVKK
jgi:hypothetical protein